MALPKQEKDTIRTAIEQQVASFLSKELSIEVDPDFVIAHSHDIKSARETSRNDEEGILVQRSPSPRAFIEESSLFKSINAAYNDKYIEVFAPISWGDKSRRESRRGSWREPIKDIITDVCLAERRSRA